MSKVLESPVKRWPGTITIPDFLTIPQAIAWEEAIGNANEILPEAEPFVKDEKLTTSQINRISASWSTKWTSLVLPGIMACVESWNLEGLDHNNFPATPPLSRVKLVAWIVNEIKKLYDEAEEIPNA